MSKEEYYTPDGRKIKRFIWINGNRVPIVEAKKGPKINDYQFNGRKPADLIEHNYDVGNSSDRYNEKQFKNEKKEWDKQEKEIHYADKDDYKGFKLKTGIPNLDRLVKTGEAYIAEMSPLEYLKRSAYDFHKNSLAEEIYNANLLTAKQYGLKMVREKSKAPLPYLDYGEITAKGGGQEGRTRVIAAYLIGCDIIPVLITRKHF